MEIESWLVTEHKVIRNVNETITHFEFDPKIAKLIKLSYVACLNLIKKAENTDYSRFMCIIYGKPPTVFTIDDLWNNRCIYFQETLCMVYEKHHYSGVMFPITEESYNTIYDNISNLFKQLNKLVESYEK